MSPSAALSGSLVQNAIEDEALVPGAGAFEIAAHAALLKFKDTVVGKPKLGVQVVPPTVEIALAHEIGGLYSCIGSSR